VVFKKPDGDRGQFTIVGKEEADPLKGKISNESPLGRAFLGHKRNEAILVSTPKGELQYKIIDIA
jgi:transcription elongation factor GreA